MTYTTEGSRSAILTMARGLGIDNDMASYIASLVIADRGMTRSLKTLYYGDEDHVPVPEFRRAMDDFPELFKGALKIEGLICGCGSHAGGVIFVDEPFTNTTALMQTNSGDIVTQFDLHEAEECSLIKIDLLSIEALDKMRAELDLLLEDGVIEWQGSLRKTYEKYIGIKTLERNDPKMWKLLHEHKVLSLFQMEKDSGTKAISLIKPTSVDQLATMNSVIRLMAQEEGAETPLDKYSRFLKDASLWNQEMDEAGLTEEEKKIIIKHLASSNGVCAFQEQIMSLVMELKLGGYSLAWADKLRKAVAKKNPKGFIELEKEYIGNIEARGISEKFARYVWYGLIYTQRGYSFNCVSGSTKVMKGATNHYASLTIEEMYNINNYIEYAKNTGHKDLRKKYNRYGYGTALSMYEDTRIRNNRIKDIRPAGMRWTYELKTKFGSSIICTDNHKFPTPNGYKQLNELKIGDVLYIKGGYADGGYNYNLSKDHEPNSRKGHMGFCTRPDGGSVLFNSTKHKYKLYTKECEMCNRRYSEDGHFELHHIDKDRTNNKAENLLWLCCSCHKKIHYKIGRVKRYEKGILTNLDEIVSIQRHCYEMTYDIEMEDPAHTFVTESGLVASNSAHTLSYSLIALQELNFCHKYPIIYWNTANLIVDSGSSEGTEKTTDYGKMSVAIANIKQNGIHVERPNINFSRRGFKPDTSNDEILFGLKAINGIGDNDVECIISNRPYTSFEDFCDRMIATKKITNSTMVALIKAGCFVELDNPDRRVTMERYLRRYVYEPNAKLTMANMKRIVSMDILPSKYELQLRILSFKDYVLQDKYFVKNVVLDKKIPKCGYHDRLFRLDATTMPFFVQNLPEESVEEVQGEYYIVSEKKFLKSCENATQELRNWIASDEALAKFNGKAFEEIWTKYASGTDAAWDMESLSYYYDKHELDGINLDEYGVVNYFELPEQPQAYDSYTRYSGGQSRDVPKFKIVRIAGTVIKSDNNHHMISLLTREGVVNVKFNKGQYAFYNQQISDRLDPNSDKKTVLDKSWFKRGTLLLICGYRQDDTFRAYRYKDTVYLHTVNKIVDIKEDGCISLLSDRVRT